MDVMCWRKVDEQQVSRQGCGGAQQLTDLDNGATASDSNSCLQYSLLLSPLILLCFLFLLPSFLLLFFSASLLTLSKSALPGAMVGNIHRCHFSCAAQPPLCLPHVCSLSRQAGLKSQLRIEPSRLKLVSTPALPAPCSPLQPQTCELLATYEKLTRRMCPRFAQVLNGSMITICMHIDPSAKRKYAVTKAVTDLLQ